MIGMPTKREPCGYCRKKRFPGFCYTYKNNWLVHCEPCPNCNPQVLSKKRKKLHMGYHELSIVGSDAASDFAWDVASTVADLFEKQIDRSSSEYNTPGFVNVALCFEAMIATSPEVFLGHEKMMNVAKKTFAEVDRAAATMQARKLFAQKNRKAKVKTDDHWDQDDERHLTRLSRLHTVIRRYLEDSDGL